MHIILSTGSFELVLQSNAQQWGYIFKVAVPKLRYLLRQSSSRRRTLYNTLRVHSLGRDAQSSWPMIVLTGRQLLDTISL